MSDIPPPVKRRPRFWWILAEFGAIIGGAILILFFPFASSAPQEASIAALAIACAVIPYCMARAVDERRNR